MAEKILIIKMSSLGDIIHAMPSLYMLRKHKPDAHITWAIHPAFAGILPGKPWVDQVYLVDRKRIKQLSYLKQVRRDLKSRHFDLVIDLQMIAKSALISMLSGCSHRIGYWDAREGSWLVNKPISGPHKHGHIIEQLLDVMRFLGCPETCIEFPFRDLTEPTQTLEKKLHDAGLHDPFVVLVPGTRGENKKWPIAMWGELAARLAERGIHSVISGAPSEKSMEEEILKRADSPYVIPMMGKTSLLELAALEKAASVHVSSDTGPLHIANAMKTPIVALFGPTMPQRSGPYGNPYSTVLMAENPGHEDTDMSTISVDQVLEEVVKKWEQKNKPLA